MLLQHLTNRSQYLELATHKDPSLSILEIGGGSGGTTFQLLSALGGGDGVPASFGNYTFTDVGPGFVSKAEDDMQAYKSSMSFKLLDIEKDPLTQGFEATCMFPVHVPSKRKPTNHTNKMMW